MKSTTEINSCACGGKAIPSMAATDLAKKCYIQCVKCGRKTERHNTIMQALADWNAFGGK